MGERMSTIRNDNISIKSQSQIRKGNSQQYRDNYDSIFGPPQWHWPTTVEHPCPCDHWWAAGRGCDCSMGCPVLTRYKLSIGYEEKPSENRKENISG
jgi:hypothetical protein